MTSTSSLTPSIVLKGHGTWIESISYFPDGQRMISGSVDKTTRQWDLKAGKEIEEARGVCEGEVNAVAVSRNGRWAATGGGDLNRAELRACEVETGILKTFKGHSSRIECIDISTDNLRLASGSFDKTARIWNMDTGKLELVVDPFEGKHSVGAVRFSPDSKKLAVMSWAGRCLEVWDVQSQKLDVKVGESPPSLGTHSPLFWTNNKNIIAAFSFKAQDLEDPKTIYEFNGSTFETVGASFQGHTNLITGLGLSFDQTLLASASIDNTIKLWAFESRQLLASFDVQNIFGLVLSPNLRQLAYKIYTKDDNNICICDIPQKVLAQNIARTKSNIDRLLHSHATLPAGHRRPPIYVISTLQRPPPTNDSQQPAFRRLTTLLRFSPRTNAVRPGRKDQSRDPLDFPATLPLSSNRIHGESAPSTSLPGGSAFFNPTRSSSGKGKQGAREPERKLAKVVDVLLGQVTYPDAVGVDDGYRLYVVFFCLSWFQKKKKPQPQPVVYDDEFDGDDDEEEENVPVPVAVPPRVPEEVELQIFADQAQPEAGPSRPAVTDHLEA